MNKIKAVKVFFSVLCIIWHFITAATFNFLRFSWPIYTYALKLEHVMMLENHTCIHGYPTLLNLLNPILLLCMQHCNRQSASKIALYGNIKKILSPEMRELNNCNLGLFLSGDINIYSFDSLLTRCL